MPSFENTSGLIRDMAYAERPRERLFKNGAEALSDAELLALVLRTGYAGCGALSLAQQLLTQNALPSLLALSPATLATLRGVGPSRAAALLAATELARRAGILINAHEVSPTLRSAQDISPHILDIRDKKKEYLLALFLNARHQLIARETISIGTLTASLAHPREIFSPAIGKAAAGVILAHNHPSGDPSPSDEDIRLTRRIRDAGHILGIELLDHVIVAEKGSYSFKTAGVL